MRHFIRAIYLALVVVMVLSCGREFLDIKRNANQVIPHTIGDYQALLDEKSTSTTPAVGLGFLGSDEYFVSADRWSALGNKAEKNGYIWAEDVYEGGDGTDWNYAYERILYANLALEVNQIEPSTAEKKAWNNVRGSACFYRAFNYYHLAQLFCKPYEASSSENELGVPLRLDYDITVKESRGTLSAVYGQMIDDLEQALELLPQISADKFRPTKAAACLLLARVYMQMADYEIAEHYASLGLGYNDELLDFNALDSSMDYSFPADDGLSNPEVLLYWRKAMSIITESRFNVDTALLALYDENDLRRQIYFRRLQDGRTIFKGSYSSRSVYFVGLAVDELWLIRAECRARLGNTVGAIEDLNVLRTHRYDSETYNPITDMDVETLLAAVLMERRKELYMRGTRWEDLRRLNKEPRFATGLVREIEGERYELPPGDERWVWPIPQNEIILNNLQQNPR